MKIAFAVAALLAGAATPALAAPIIYTIDGSFTGIRAGVGAFTVPATFTGIGDTASAVTANFGLGSYVSVPLTSLSAVSGGETFVIKTPASFVSIGNNVGFMFNNQFLNSFGVGLPMPGSYNGVGTMLTTKVSPVFVAATFATDKGQVSLSGLGANATFLARVNAVGAVPEAATWAMMVLGFGAVGFGLRRRRTAVRTSVRFA